MPDRNRSEDDLEARVNKVELDNVRLAVTLEAIKHNTDELVNFARQQVRIEERQIEQGRAIERAFTALEMCRKDVSDRLTLIEVEMPTIKLVRGWIFSFVLWAMGMTGAVVWQIIFK